MTKDLLWTAQDIARACGTESAGDWRARELCFDSRAIMAGDVFIALKAADFPALGGGTTDGHKYVADAFARGAVAAIVERVPDGMDGHDPRLVVVPSTRAALDDLARHARGRSGARVIAVTGSVGKTSTREMLSLALSPFGKTYESAKNYNNEMGVPIVLGNLPQATDYAIIELGMSHAGEITPLSRLACPDIAIITTVAPAHIENFENGIDGIADAKAEIFVGLKDDGIAIINHDMPSYARVMNSAMTMGVGRIFTFGEHPEADACMVGCIEARNGCRVTARVMGVEVSFTLPAGKHQAMNALAVLLAVKLSGMDIEKAAAALSSFSPVGGRGSEEKLDIGDAGNPVVLIDESYNASPASMNAAFRVMALIDPGRGGRRIAILGDMLELGSHGPKLHAELAMPLRAANIDLVYTCGALMKNLHDALPANARGAHRDTSAELAQIVPDVLVPGDVVVVKGSHGSRMDLVVEALRALPARKSSAANNKDQNRHAL